MLEGNSKRQSTHTYNDFFVEIKYRCYFVAANKEAVVPFSYKESYSKTEMTQYREYVSCTCQTYYSTGWVCRHAIQVYVRLGFDIKAAVANLAPNLAPGRPKKSTCTYKDELDKPEFFCTHPHKLSNRDVQK